MTMPSNLLYLLTDQQRPDTLGCYGNGLVDTPNIDRLAAEGTLFERAYCTQPVCTPSRSSLMTGFCPHRTGCITNHVPLPADLATLAELVSPDYERAYFGKWHLGNEVIPQRGFDTWVSVDDDYREHYSRPEYLQQLSTYHHFLVQHGYEPDQEVLGARIFGRATAARLPEHLTKPAFLAQAASRFLRGIGRQPFAMVVSFLEPHPPWLEEMDGIYPPEAVPVGPTFRHPPSEQAALLNRLMAESYRTAETLYGVDLSTDVGWRRLRARYLALAARVDRAVGQILAALAESGHADDTIVVFTSDHGEMAGDHGLFQKGYLYEGSVRVPLILHLPGVAPRRIAAPVSQIDLLPTLLDLLEQPVPAGLPGQSRASVLRSGSAWPAYDVVVEWNGDAGRRPSKWVRPRQDPAALPWERVRGPWRSLVAPDGFKLNLAAHDQCELYDLQRDPHEQINVFDRPEQQPRRRQMAARLRAWQATTGDTAPLPIL